MKTFTAKTQEEALELASKEFGIPVSELTYKVHDKKVGIFNKKVAVDIYELADIVKYAEDYVLGIIDALGIESSPHTRLDDDIIRITIDSTHNPILIGKNGRTLQALNELTKLAVSTLSVSAELKLPFIMLIACIVPFKDLFIIPLKDLFIIPLKSKELRVFSILLLIFSWLF